MTLLSEILASEIRRRGVIRFSRFMELALYCPHCGFYEQEADNLGRRGHYYTSVSVGSLFGELLAFQFSRWLDELWKDGTADGSAPFQLVEAGAHDGKLARDVLGWMARHRPGVLAGVEYCILEPSARRREWQRESLSAFAGKVRWLADLEDVRECLPSVERNDLRGVCGIVFSNEFLDALPARRLGWDARAKQWFEWGVALDGERFVWARMPGDIHGLLKQAGLNASPALLEVLPDGFAVEVCPAAVAWWRQAAGCLLRGKLMTVDYGLTADEWFAPQRGSGSLRGYRQHQVTADVLANPGTQDLTAHVNFTALQAAGQAEGLMTHTLTTQTRFLVKIVEQTWCEPRLFDEWNDKRLLQLKTLSHPEHLGRPFRVLVQSRGN